MRVNQHNPQPSAPRVSHIFPDLLVIVIVVLQIFVAESAVHGIQIQTESQIKSQKRDHEKSETQPSAPPSSASLFLSSSVSWGSKFPSPAGLRQRNDPRPPDIPLHFLGKWNYPAIYCVKCVCVFNVSCNSRFPHLRLVFWLEPSKTTQRDLAHMSGGLDPVPRHTLHKQRCRVELFTLPFPRVPPMPSKRIPLPKETANTGEANLSGSRRHSRRFSEGLQPFSFCQFEAMSGVGLKISKIGLHPQHVVHSLDTEPNKQGKSETTQSMICTLNWLFLI